MTEQEIRARINAGNASDADFDWLIDNGIDVNTLGPKGQEAYKARQAARQQTNNTPKKEATAEDLLAQQNPKDYINNLNEQGVSKADLRDNIPDNADYKDAIKGTDYDDSQSKNQSYKLRSIQDAYLAGDLDKSSRDYLIADTLSNFTRNLGRDMGNVAAAYSGGSVNNERDQSLWEQRNKGMAESALGAEQSNVEGSKEQRAAKKSNLEIDKGSMQLAPAKQLSAIANDPNQNPVARGAAMYASARMAGAELDTAALIATVGATAYSQIEKDAAAKKMSVTDYLAQAAATNPAINVAVNAGQRAYDSAADYFNKKGDYGVTASEARNGIIANRDISNADFMNAAQADAAELGIKIDPNLKLSVPNATPKQAVALKYLNERGFKDDFGNKLADNDIDEIMYILKTNPNISVKQALMNGHFRFKDQQLDYAGAK